jgi:hypothetical protein
VGYCVNREIAELAIGRCETEDEPNLFDAPVLQLCSRDGKFISYSLRLSDENAIVTRSGEVHKGSSWAGADFSA